jgi:cysteine desulfurase/selenocysteine lyase
LSSEIIFVRGATEAINLVANTVGKLNIRKNDEIILSRLEHHSNIVPWQILADMNSAVIKVAEPDIYGNITLDSITKLISSNTKLISLTHVSNAIGTILPIKEICKEAKSRGIITLIDGCQAAPHMKIDVKELNCDFYVFSGHKTYGPTGIGVLYGRKELLEDAPPYQGGGDMIDKVTFEKTTYAPLPHKFEAGTPNIIGAIVLGEAITWMHKIGIENINNHLKKVTDRGLKILKNIKGIQIIGEIENRAGVISFLYKDSHPHDIATMLDTYDIALRTGHHCAQPTMQFFNVSSTLRASVGIYNSEQDFIKLEECIDKIKNMI